MYALLFGGENSNYTMFFKNLPSCISTATLSAIPNQIFAYKLQRQKCGKTCPSNGNGCFSAEWIVGMKELLESRFVLLGFDVHLVQWRNRLASLQRQSRENVLLSALRTILARVVFEVYMSSLLKVRPCISVSGTPVVKLVGLRIREIPRLRLFLFQRLWKNYSRACVLDGVESRSTVRSSSIIAQRSERELSVERYAQKLIHCWYSSMKTSALVFLSR